MAEWLGFYGPKRGPGSVEDYVSHMSAVRTELKAQGSAIAARARSNLAVHRKDGDARIAVIAPPQTKLDWHIALYDVGSQDNVPDRTDNNNKSAISIEMGHWQKTKEGRVWVDGIHALGNAVEDRVRKYGKTS